MSSYRVDRGLRTRLVPPQIRVASQVKFFVPPTHNVRVPTEQFAETCGNNIDILDCVHVDEIAYGIVNND